jgi:hypothetical protein
LNVRRRTPHCWCNDREAYSSLLNVLMLEQRLLVQHIPRGDAHGVWQVLSARYDRKTAASKHYTRTKLHNTRMERSEKFDNYLARLKDLAQRLHSMNAPVSDDELLLAMLKGLPSSFRFDRVFLALEARSDARRSGGLLP